jgi:GNAT superfamily N-acetyltransferase
VGTLFRSYVKRFRMHRRVDGWLPPAELPAGLVLVPWDVSQIPVYADVLARTFRATIDARLFPNLAQYGGCLSLMEIIAGHPGFVPGATWLIRHQDDGVACIQGVRQEGGAGVFQNVAVRPGFQGRGLGKVLLHAGLVGFHAGGVREARLEVSAKNDRAVRLYHHFGFQRLKTIYRETQPDAAEYNI